MNLDAAMQTLLIRLRTIDRAIEQFENLAEGQIASRKPKVQSPPGDNAATSAPSHWANSCNA